MSILAIQYKHLSDKIAIGLSIACAAHCLLMPTFVLALPLFFSGQLDNELFHRLMLWVIVPVSLYALASGYNNHKKIPIFYLGLAGILMLISAVTIEEIFLGEELITLLGSIIITLAHFLNWKNCTQE
jgi:hypothetical protein